MLSDYMYEMIFDFNEMWYAHRAGCAKPLYYANKVYNC